MQILSNSGFSLEFSLELCYRNQFVVNLINQPYFPKNHSSICIVYLIPEIYTI